MLCHRCKKDFAPSDLHPPALHLRVLAAPFFYLFLLRTPELRTEFVASYCRPCRRQLSFCFFFAAFAVVVVAVVAVMALMAKLGIVLPIP
jgi:hypothetical protein